MKSSDGREDLSLPGQQSSKVARKKKKSKMRNLVRIEFCLLGVWDGEIQKLLHVSITLYTCCCTWRWGWGRDAAFVLFCFCWETENSLPKRGSLQRVGVFMNQFGDLYPHYCVWSGPCFSQRGPEGHR